MCVNLKRKSKLSHHFSFSGEERGKKLEKNVRILFENTKEFRMMDIIVNGLFDITPKRF